MVIEELVITKIVDAIFEKYRKIKDELKETISIFQFPTDNFVHFELDDETTTSTEFDHDTANMEFENPFKRKTLIKGISIVPDDNFKSNGLVEIYIDDEIIYHNKKAGNFANISQSKIELSRGKPIKAGKSVKVFLKTDDESVTVGLAVEVYFGDTN